EGVEETFGMAWRLFATMLERAETTEAVGLNWARLHSTRPPRNVAQRLGIDDRPARCKTAANRGPEL
ncbi:MAG: hypothetical protein ABSF95_19505, partial [Verrucomicrobiota bacterium]